MSNIAVPTGTGIRRLVNGLYVVSRVHTVAANLSQNDTMDLPALPEDARVYDIGISCSAAVSSGTVNIGTTGTAAFFGASIAMATANLVGKANLRLGFLLDAGTVIRFVFNSAAAPAATDVLTAYALLSVDEALIDSEAAA